MPNLETEIAHQIISPQGTLNLNAGTGDRYLIVRDSYKILPSIRLTEEPISQQDGSVLHPRYKTGLVATFSLEYWKDADPACGSDLMTMHNTLVKHCHALLRPTAANNDQRFLWTPTGFGDNKFLDEILLLGWPDPTHDGRVSTVQMALETPFPYGVKATQHNDAIGAGSNANLNNTGSVDSYPVLQVNGATSSFTITNTTTGLSIVYSGTAIAGGHYVEVDMFRGTAYLDGSGASRLSGVDPTTSDFFPLVPGVNNISATGASVNVLWNEAYG